MKQGGKNNHNSVAGRLYCQNLFLFCNILAVRALLLSRLLTQTIDLCLVSHSGFEPKTFLYDL